MREELQEALYRDFPDLYANRILETCMCWGFDCGDGWEPLIRRLSEKLSKIDGVRAEQVKEKFGTLRFYLDYEVEGAQDLIDEAEEESARTCEQCGQPGKLRGGGWMVTLCDSCSK